MHVILRSPRFHHYARVRKVSNARGELFYLQVLLQHRPASSFADIRTIDSVECATFQEAATVSGIFGTQNEAEYALSESVHALKTSAQLRHFFVHLLVTDSILTPVQCWNTFLPHLCLDFSRHYPSSSDYATEHALRHLSALLQEHRKQPSDYQLPQVFTPGREVEHERQKWAPIVRQLERRANCARNTFNAEQECIFAEILLAVNEEKPLLLFVDGKAGVGKTFLINAICDKVRSQNLIALPTATSAFAAQLYQGGRTAHSTFKVKLSIRNLPSAC